MAFARTVDLYLNTARTPGSVLFGGKIDPTPAETPQWVQGDKHAVRLWFLEPDGSVVGGAPEVVALQAGDVIGLSGRRNGTLLFAATGFVETGAGDGLHYAGVVDLNTVEIGEALATEEQIVAVVDVEVQDATNALRFTLQAQIIIKRQAHTGDPATPAGVPYPPASALLWYRADITALTGGGENALDGIATAAGATAAGTTYVLTAGGVAFWRLIAGTNATDIDLGYMRPADYAAGTNEFVWERIPWAEDTVLALLRKGTDSERLTITLEDGEPFWTTDTKLLYVGDGVTAGGILSGIGGSSTTTAITIGVGATAGGNQSVVIGPGANGAGQADTTAVGHGAVVGGLSATIFGCAAVAGENSVAVGRSALADALDACAVGPTAAANTDGATAFGPNATADDAGCTSVGASAYTAGEGSVAVGESAIAEGQASVAIGQGAGASAVRTIAIGMNATVVSSGQMAVRLGSGTGVIQAITQEWEGTTTDATANVELSTGGAAGNRATIVSNGLWHGTLRLVARKSDGTKFLAATRQLTIRRNNSDGTALIGAVQTIGTDVSEGAPAWTFTIDANDTNETLRVRVTGAVGETVAWGVIFQGIECRA